jgi:hypothetical protein
MIESYKSKKNEPGHDSEKDEVFGQFNRLLHLTKEVDERGLVLSMAAFAEESLARLLRAYLRPGKAADDLVDGFSAPLGTFSARIKAAYALGLLSNEQMADLDLLKKIRNEFAHNWEGCNFEVERIKSLVLEMNPSRIHPEEPKTLKRKFHYSITCNLVELEYLISTLGQGKRSVPVVAAHLSTKPPVP